MHEREYHCKPEDGRRRQRDHAVPKSARPREGGDPGPSGFPLEFTPTRRSSVVYSVIDTTTPEPTVLLPSRIANRCFSSIAIGVISSTSIAALSPGMIISVPAGSVT